MSVNMRNSFFQEQLSVVKRVFMLLNILLIRASQAVN